MERHLFKRVKAGAAISARTLNQVPDWLESQHVRAGPGITVTPTINGPIISADVVVWHYAFPTGAIPARTGSPPNDLTPGSGTAEIYEYRPDTGKLVIVGHNRPVLNAFGGAVSRALIKVDFRWGQWWVNAEDCNDEIGVQDGFSTGFSAGFGVSADGGTSSGTDSGFDGGFSSGFGARVAINEIQEISTTGSPSSGSLTISHSTMSSSYAVAYNTTSTTLQAALDARASGGGGFLVSGGPWPGTALRIEWIGTYGSTNQAALTYVISTLSPGAPAGPTTIQNGSP